MRLLQAVQQWKIVCGRISGLLELAHLYRGGSQEYHGASNETLVPKARDMFPLIEKFHADFQSVLPTAAGGALSTFINHRRKVFAQGSGVDGYQGALFLVGLLAMLRGEVDYHLGDPEVAVLRRVERAFVHLNRSIVVDQDVRTKWNQAFLDGETRCEALGAVHLLAHGIWAFKAHAQGGRTDLILGGPPNLDEAAQVAEGLVLTEWKRLTASDTPLEKALAAREQAERYASDTIAGFEIESRRFIILVSLKTISPLPAVPAGGSGVHYEVVGIAVDPDVPSLQS